MASNDGRRCARIAAQSAAFVPDRLSYEQFERDISSVVAAANGAAVDEFVVAEFVAKLFDVQRRHRIYGTTSFTTAILALVVFEGIAKRVAGDLDFQREALPYLFRAAQGGWARDRAAAASPRKMPRRRLATRLLALDEEETSFERRGFAACAPSTRVVLERHGAAFVQGFNTALGTRAGREFDECIEEVARAERGFAYEGGAMAYALLDLVVPGRGGRLTRHRSGTGAAHVYMIHVGAGWALARLRRRRDVRLRLDPLLRWLAVDGHGFHAGFFEPERFVRRRELPTRLRGYARRGFDQGLGRSLWFVEGADVERIAARIATFEGDRHADLWSGVGLAAAYAGAVDREGLELLRACAGPYLADAAQGAAFAATARLHAGNPVAHTRLACEVLCGTDDADVATIVERAHAAVRPDDDGAYELWRSRIRTALRTEVPA
jgi:hypothetical protein